MNERTPDSFTSSTPSRPLFAAVLETRGYVVGTANAAAGLHRLDAAGWTHLGWQNVRSHGLCFQPNRPAHGFMAASNGVFRTGDGGRTWRITTGWEITEVLDVAIDPFDPARIYASSAYGVWVSEDDGEHWRASGTGIPEPLYTYCPVIEADRTVSGVILVGSEGGLFRSEDGGATWHPVGPAAPVRHLAQSAADAALWIAVTSDQGVFLSRDGGRRWLPAGPLGSGMVILYTSALDPADPDRMAVGGYETGVWVSDTGGRSWRRFGGRLPQPTVHALLFESGPGGRLWAGTAGGGLFVGDGASWRHAGLSEATIYDLAFAGGAS